MPPHHLLMYKIHESYAISVSIVLSTSHAFHHSRCSRAFGKILKPGEFNGGGTAAGWSSVFFVWIEFNFPHPLSHFTDKLDWISRWVFHPQGLVGDDNFHKIHSDSPAADRAGPPSHPGGLARQKTNFYKRVVVLKDHGFGSDFKGFFLRQFQLGERWHDFLIFFAPICPRVAIQVWLHKMPCRCSAVIVVEGRVGWMLKQIG